MNPYAELPTAIRIKQSLAGHMAPQTDGVIAIDFMQLHRPVGTDSRR